MSCVRTSPWAGLRECSAGAFAIPKVTTLFDFIRRTARSEGGQRDGDPTRAPQRYGLYDHGCQTGIAISAKEGISMKNNELVVSLMFGTMATFRSEGKERGSRRREHSSQVGKIGVVCLRRLGGNQPPVPSAFLPGCTCFR